MQRSAGTAFARAALAGNPSDGYGGKVLAVIIRDFAARAEVARAHGASANSAGSGGAVVGTFPDAVSRPALVDALRRAGYRIVLPTRSGGGAQRP